MTRDDGDGSRSGDVTRVHIYAPHPDDAELFAGVALMRHARAGDDVTVLLMTRGDTGTWMPWRRGEALAQRRMGEMQARLAQLPGVKLEWLGFHDGSIPSDEAAVAKIAARIAADAPDIIYLPESDRNSTLYSHPDHLATGRVVRAAACGPCELRFYHSRHPTLFTPVDPATWAESQAALTFHASQCGVTAFPPFLVPLFRVLRALQFRRWGNAEAFRVETLSSRPLRSSALKKPTTS